MRYRGRGSHTNAERSAMTGGFWRARPSCFVRFKDEGGSLEGRGRSRKGRRDRIAAIVYAAGPEPRQGCSAPGHCRRSMRLVIDGIQRVPGLVITVSSQFEIEIDTTRIDGAARTLPKRAAESENFIPDATQASHSRRLAQSKPKSKRVR